MPVLSYCHAVYEGEYMAWSDIKERMEKRGRWPACGGHDAEPC